MPLPQLDGSLRFDAAALEAMGDDFGHLVRRTPEAVLEPASGDDVAAVVRWAERTGRTVVARGAGHSTFGRSQRSDGIVVDMSRLGRIGPAQADRITVDAGTTWGTLLDTTLPLGLTPPVLPNYLPLSVGGTVVVGGIGDTTATSGAISDTVLELEVVTGCGETLRCSADERRDLFDAVRGGLAQVAIVTQVTLRLVAAPGWVRQTELHYAEAAAMLGDAERLAAQDGVDVVQGAVVPTPHGWDHRLDVASFVYEWETRSHATLAGLADEPGLRRTSMSDFAAYSGRLDALEHAMRQNGHWSLPHPWLTTFVGASAIASVLDAELDDIEPATGLGPMGQVVVAPLRRSTVATPLLRLPDEDRCYALNLIRIPASADGADRLVRENARALERVLAAGGTLYPVAAVGLTAAAWRQHFGAAFPRLAAAKRIYDPAGTLACGYGVMTGDGEPTGTCDGQGRPGHQPVA